MARLRGCPAWLCLAVLGAATVSAAHRSLSALPSTCVYIRAGNHFVQLSWYAHNIHHQSEFVFPAIETLFKLTSDRYGVAAPPKGGPVVVVTDLNLLPWSRAVLHLASPDATIVDSQDALDTRKSRAALQSCGGLMAAKSDRVPDPFRQQYFKNAVTFELLRVAASKACKLAIPRQCASGAKKAVVRIGVLNRHTNRQIVEPEAFVAALQRSLAGAEVELRSTASDPTICQQIGWFSGVDVLVVAHGAALTNALFLPSGAALVEVMPRGFGLNIYNVYNATAIGSGVQWRQVVSQLHSYEVYTKLNGGNFTMTECLSGNRACYLWHRDRPLRPATDDVVTAIKSMGALQAVCQG